MIFAFEGPTIGDKELDLLLGLTTIEELEFATRLTLKEIESMSLEDVKKACKESGVVINKEELEKR